MRRREAVAGATLAAVVMTLLTAPFAVTPEVRLAGSSARGNEAAPRALPPAAVPPAAVPQAAALAALRPQREASPAPTPPTGRPCARLASGEEYTHCLRIVTGAAQRPIADAVVTLSGTRASDPPGDELDPVTLRTDSRGELRLVLDREVDACVRAPGMAVEAEAIQWQPTEPRQVVTIALRPGMQVSGRLVDAEGRPVEGARIVVDSGLAKATDFVARGSCGNWRNDWSRDFGTTDGQGSFGPVECYVGGAASFVAEFELRRFVFAHVAWTGDGESDPFVELELPPLRLVRVRVVEGNGEPREDQRVVAVRCFDWWSELEEWEGTDRDGRAEFSLPAAGRWRFEWWDADDEGRDFTVAVQELEVGGGVQSIELRDPRPAPVAPADDDDNDDDNDDESDDAGDEDADVAEVADATEAIDEVIPTDATIRGRIVCSCAEGECEWTKLWLFDARAAIAASLAERDGESLDSEWCEDDGTFEFDQLAPGDYVVVASANGHAELITTPFAVAASAPVDLGDRLAVPLPPVRGRLVAVGAERAPSPTALAEIELELSTAAGDNGLCSSTVSDGEGRFVLPGIAGATQVKLFSARIGATTLPLPCSRPFEWQVELPRSRRLSGVVRVPRDSDVGALSVRCREVPDAERHRGWSEDRFAAVSIVAPLQSDGTFRFEEAAPTECRLELISRDRWSREQALLARRDVPAGGDLDVGAWELPALVPRVTWRDRR